MVFIHPSDANVIQAGRAIPGAIMQPKMTTQDISQLFGSLNNYPQQNPQLGLWQELRKAESRTLGAVQIIIGLVHIGFGSLSAVLWDAYPHYTPLATYGAYPFWGGVFFIVSGSLSVAADRRRNTCLVQCSVGMNITSAIMSLIGAILYIAELIINLLNFKYDLTESIGVGVALLLLIFSLVEFCITVSTAHFGCQAACCKNDMTVVVVPYTVLKNDEISAENIPAESNQSPPAHNDVVVSSAEDVPAEPKLYPRIHDNMGFSP